ncbi:hypothetical protein AB0M02_09675 [Actinoplanes sp. NPDC051861]|uniref:hypothetical protein n=1 Tax=Actinoplanes sp. NPDC051861 TaxID=3155170 RepID=UPI00343DB69A
MARFVRFAAALILLAALTGCSRDSDSPADSGTTADTPAGSGATADSRGGSGATADSRGGSGTADSRGGSGDPSESRGGSGGPSENGSAPLVDDPPGLITCREVAAALRDATLMDPGVVDHIVASSATADAPVADAAAALAGAYARAVAQHGKTGEPDAIAAVSGAAADMSKICGESGLESVG